MLAFWFLSGPGVLPAGARQMQLETFQFTAEVARDGSVEVQETITARFEGAWNGMLRQLPLLANRPTGLEPLGLTLESVSDEQGRPYRVESLPAGGQRELRIFIPNAKDTRRTVVLRYRVRRGVRFYPDHDEINWNITGNGWLFPIDRVNARVLLPEGARGVHASAYTGVRGAHGHDAVLRLEGREVTARSTRRLAPGEGLTFAVGFDKGLVAPRPWFERLLVWLVAHLVLLFPLVPGVVLGGVWCWRARSRIVGAVAVRYEPPQGMTPAGFAALLTERLETVTLGATLINLAVKGHLSMQRLPEHGPESGGYRFTLRTGHSQWQALAPEERHLLVSLFYPREPDVWVDTDNLKRRFYRYVPFFHKLVADDCVARGFYRSWPGDERVQTLLVCGFTAGFLLTFVLALLPPELVQLQKASHPLMSVLAVPLTLLVVGLLSWLMPRRTERGVAVLRECLGFREFLRRVESPRYQRLMLTPEMFERNLAYAMVVGLTKQWVSAFRATLIAPPDWYGFENHFDVDVFFGDLVDCLDCANESMVLAPPANGSGFGSSDFGDSSSSFGDSSSGSSDGGSSGGADGGGGGGGF